MAINCQERKSRFLVHVCLARLIAAWLCCASLSTISTSSVQAGPLQHELGQSNDSTNTLRLAVGPVYRQLTEKLLFGELHSGFTMGSMLDFYHQRGSHRHTFALWDSYGQITNPDGLPALDVNLTAAYSYGYKIYQGIDHRLHWFVGPQFAARYSVQVFSFLDDSHGYWLTHYDVAISNQVDYSLNRQIRLLGSLSIPVVGFISRPKYRRNYNSDLPEAGYIIDEIHRDLRLSSLNNYGKLNLEVGAQFEFGHHWREILSYRLDYSYTNLPVKRKSLDQALLLSILYRF